MKYDPMTPQNQTSELKPCPFCGSNQCHTVENPAEENFKVSCANCHCFSGRYRTNPEAITAWNTRHTPAPVEEKSQSESRGESSCKEYWNKLPFTSEHLWQADIHGLPFGNCTKCGKSIQDWNDKLDSKAMTLYASGQSKPTPTDSSVDEITDEITEEIAVKIVGHLGYKQHIRGFDMVRKTITEALESHTAELRKDKERLDWLAEHPEITIYKGLFNGQMQWWLHRITPHDIQYNSLRQSIDTAINQQNKT